MYAIALRDTGLGPAFGMDRVRGTPTDPFQMDMQFGTPTLLSALTEKERGIWYWEN